MRYCGYYYKGKTYVKSKTPKGNFVSIELFLYLKMREENEG